MKSEILLALCACLCGCGTQRAVHDNAMSLKFHCAELGRHELERDQNNAGKLRTLAVTKFGFNAELKTCIYEENYYEGDISGGFIEDLLTGIYGYAREAVS